MHTHTHVLVFCSRELDAEVAHELAELGDVELAVRALIVRREELRGAAVSNLMNSRDIMTTLEENYSAVVNKRPQMQMKLGESTRSMSKEMMDLPITHPRVKTPSETMPVSWDKTGTQATKTL